MSSWLEPLQGMSLLTLAARRPVRALVGFRTTSDEINHVMTCEGYDTKPPKNDKGDEKIIAEYLIELNSERIRRWGCPLIYIKGFWTREHHRRRPRQDESLWNLGSLKTIKFDTKLKANLSNSIVILNSNCNLNSTYNCVLLLLIVIVTIINEPN